ncbi:hypothetical protein GCM10009123_14960 [Kangiella japonica]|uniref:Lipoprotein n=1 Tax=Kangiella japonica TaxID=647384 RepID=A0ABN0T0J4_9GAMM
MLKPLVILGLSFAFLGCATNSPSTDNNTKTEQASSDSKDQKVICKKSARVGSHFKKMQCWTVAEYKARQERDRQKIQDAQAHGSTMTPPSK